MDNYEATTRIIIILNHIAMLRNFIDPRKNLFKFLCSWIWIISLIFTIVVCEFCIEFYLITILMPRNIESLTYIFLFAVHVFGYIIVAIIGLYQSKNALALVKQINQVDENLRNMGIKIDYHNLFRHVKIIGCFWLLDATIICGIFLKRILRNLSIISIMVIGSYIFVTNANSIILYDYNVAVYWLGSRFEMINELLKTFLSEDDQLNSEESSEEVVFKPSNNFRNRLQIDNCSSSRSLEVSTSSTNDTSSSKKELTINEKIHLFQRIRILHLQVCNVSKMVNHIFNAQILIYTITSLIVFDISVYCLYMGMRRGTFPDICLILIFVMGNIFRILKIALISYDCEYTMKQADKTISLVHSCPLYRESAELKNENVSMLIKQIDEVDENLRSLGVKIDYHNLFHRVIIVGFFWILNATIIYAILLHWIVHKTPNVDATLTIIYYIYVSNVHSVILYEYNATIFWLGSRFKMINQLLKTLPSEDNEGNATESNEEIIFKPSSNFRNQLEVGCSVSVCSSQVSQISSMNVTSNLKKESPTDENLRLLQQIRLLHLQVCNVSKMVNQIFNTQILIYTFSQLLYSCVCVYFIYMETRRRNDFIGALALEIVYLSDSILSVLKIAVMSIDCEYAMRQADKTISLIHACPLYRESTELKNETLQFLWQISYTQLEDTKSVHYVLNYNFVRNCFYFVLTYLVIMVQLSQNLI
ncbi:uncharacterized protein LOC122527246 [Frieseomelitta varia]|uniref:uncharacterized protein LOC122527246 n=1 Tax=Frieseomelitta varia TaxID=561572 RepID=UPI001CB683E3|nr:uncharacterized protein LOC122527246 [Frieseomelitta varia]